MNLPDLHSHSTFSSALAQGDALGMPKAVVERAVELGWGAACLTEHGWMGSAPTFYKACVEKGIKPILGCELYVCPTSDEREKNFHLTVLALSKEGYYNLVAWTTFASRRDSERDNFKYKPKITVEEMIEHAPYPLHHNVILTGCMAGELAQSQITLPWGLARSSRTCIPGWT